MLTKEKEITRLKNLIAINNELFRDYAISESKFNRIANQIEKQRIAKKITLEELKKEGN